MTCPFIASWSSARVSAGNPHPYHFVVYALDTTLPAPKPGLPALTRAELHEAMKGHVIGQGELVANYGRQRP